MTKPAWLEPLEQTGHFFMGFGCRLLYLDYLLWRREKKQLPPATEREPVLWAQQIVFGSGPFLGQDTGKWDASEQPAFPDDRQYWSANRVRDMMEDMRWYYIGATCAEVVRWGLIGLVVW